MGGSDFGLGLGITFGLVQYRGMHHGHRGWFLGSSAGVALLKSVKVMTVMCDYDDQECY